MLRRAWRVAWEVMFVALETVEERSDELRRRGLVAQANRAIHPFVTSSLLALIPLHEDLFTIGSSPRHKLCLTLTERATRIPPPPPMKERRKP